MSIKVIVTHFMPVSRIVPIIGAKTVQTETQTVDNTASVPFNITAETTDNYTYKGVFRIYSSGDAYISVGQGIPVAYIPTDGVISPRSDCLLFIPAGSTLDIAVSGGYRVAAISAL